MKIAGTRTGMGAAVRRLGRSRLIIFLAAMGPGIIAANADNDAGAITTWSFIGSKYGYALTWLLVVMTPILFIAQEMNARIGIVTGKGLAGLIRERFTLKLTAFAMVAVMIANLGTTLSEWSGVAAASGLLHVPTWIGVPVVAAGVWFLVTKGNYRKVEKVFLAMGLIYGVYIAAGVVSHPDWAEASKAVVHPTVQFNTVFLISAIAAIGTTVTPWGQFFIQAAVVDKKLPVAHLKYTRIEVLIGAFITTGVDFFIMIACVETLFRRGIIVETAAQAAQALEPIVGSFAKYLFAIGLLNVSMLASAILPLATAYVVCEAFGFESGLDHGFREAPVFNGLLTAYIVLPALVVLIPALPLVSVILTAQTINGILLPIILVFVLRVINQPEVMGEYVNGRVYNFIAWAFTVVLIMLSLALVLSVLPIPGF
jgi:NRAMP (natural resistance-associated macrophage protein)-like metal ion transporter